MSVSLVDELIKVLKNSEKRRCRNYIKTTNTGLVALYDLYAKVEFKGVNPSIPVKSSEQRLKENQLKAVIEDFLLINEFKNSSWVKEKKLLKILSVRGAVRNYQLKLNKLKKEINNSEKENIEKYNTQYELGLMEYEHQLNYENKRETDLSQIIMYSDLEMIIEKLKQACIRVAQKYLIKKDYDTGLQALIIDHVRQNDNLLNFPLVAIYYYAFEMTLNNAEEHFTKCILTLKSNQHKFNAELISSIYTMAINFCIRRLNAGDREFGRKGLELSKESLENSLVQSEISIYKYRNIVMMAIRSEEFEWAESFCNEFRDRINNKDKESYFAFNMAVINYHKQEYIIAINYLNKININEASFVLSIRVLQMKIYYETKEWIVLSYHLDAMKVYLHRQNLLGHRKNNYDNIVKIVKALMKNDQGRKQKDKLRLRIEKMEPLTEKKWILDQIS